MSATKLHLLMIICKYFEENVTKKNKTSAELEIEGCSNPKINTPSDALLNA